MNGTLNSLFVYLYFILVGLLKLLILFLLLLLFQLLLKQLSLIIIIIIIQIIINIEYVLIKTIHLFILLNTANIIRMIDWWALWIQIIFWMMLSKHIGLKIWWDICLLHYCFSVLKEASNTTLNQYCGLFTKEMFIWWWLNRNLRFVLDVIGGVWHEI